MAGNLTNIKWNLISIILFSVSVVIVASLFLLNRSVTVPPGNQACVTSVEERTVRGGSLSGLIEDGQIIEAHFGYYGCNEAERGDVILYNYAGNSGPVIKIVKGIPGDIFDLEATTGGWNILINGKLVRNSLGESYILSEGGYKMLSLYRDDYDGLIPDSAYLIMGNQINGSADSTRFGLVHKNDLLGKVSFVK